MTPDSEGLGAAVVAGVGSKPHSVQWYFIFLPILHQYLSWAGILC